MAAEYGWSERFIRYQLPLARVIVYHHCIQFGNPYVWTVKPPRYLPRLSAEDIRAIVLEPEHIDLSDE
ncbi:MAG: hypothetical protein AAF236_00800 [Verrucomicrobiota bacterium]